MAKTRRWVTVSFSISVDDVEAVLKDIDKIAKRERTSRSSVIISAMKEYRDRHIQGQSQTLLPSFQEGGELNTAAIEGRIREYFRHLDDEGRDVRWRDIICLCKEGIQNNKTALSIAKRVDVWLRKRGVKVWR